MREARSRRARQPVRHFCLGTQEIEPGDVGVGWCSLYADIGAPGQFRKIMPGDQAHPFFPTKNQHHARLLRSFLFFFFIPFSVVPFSWFELASPTYVGASLALELAREWKGRYWWRAYRPREENVLKRCARWRGELDGTHWGWPKERENGPLSFSRREKFRRPFHHGADWGLITTPRRTKDTWQTLCLSDRSKVVSEAAYPRTIPFNDSFND